MTERQREHHLLIIDDDRGRRTIALEAAAYSIGRDPSNAIVLYSDTVSRQHATLLRVPIPKTDRYIYRLLDGNAEGKPSSNGVFVNGQRCSSHKLDQADKITFGKHVTAYYQVVQGETAEFVRYAETPDFHALKSEVVSSKETYVSQQRDPEEDWDKILREPAQQFSKDKVSQAIAAPAKSQSTRWLMAIAVALGGAIALGAIGWWWTHAGNQAPTQPAPSAPTNVRP